MPRKPKNPKTCQHCDGHFTSGIRKHVEACGKKYAQRRLMRERRHIRLQKQVDHGNRREASPVQAAATTTPIFNEPPLVDASQTENGTPPPRDSASPALMAVDDQPSRIQIEIEYHPHSGKGRTIIPLDSTRGGESTSTRVRRQLVPTGRPPWAPFPSRADFTWAETVYMMPEATIAAQLKGPHSNEWCDKSYLTIKTVDDLKMYLKRAKNYVVEEWLLDLVSDPTLVDEIVWYPSRKYLVVDGVRQRLRDEAYNSDTLWEMQSALPFVPGIPHCLLPMLLWLDKGRVSSHTNMHPMILRPLFLRSKIRNASGNGGGELAGFMVQVTRSQIDNPTICVKKNARDMYRTDDLSQSREWFRLISWATETVNVSLFVPPNAISSMTLLRSGFTIPRLSLVALSLPAFVLPRVISAFTYPRLIGSAIPAVPAGRLPAAGCCLPPPPLTSPSSPPFARGSVPVARSRTSLCQLPPPLSGSGATLSCFVTHFCPSLSSRS
ncbi:hypothetical protein DFH06DRAFT_1424357 [Mycena polygramma]|nr:hypothetical protein DFH06DRAFT_1424357 [Mycena polygramma]